MDIEKWLDSSEQRSQHNVGLVSTSELMPDDIKRGLLHVIGFEGKDGRRIEHPDDLNWGDKCFDCLHVIILNRSGNFEAALASLKPGQPMRIWVVRGAAHTHPDDLTSRLRSAGFELPIDKQEDIVDKLRDSGTIELQEQLRVEALTAYRPLKSRA